MDKLAVQSRYTRINYWSRAPHVVRFSDHLIRQMIKSGRESARAATGAVSLTTGKGVWR
jgi:hypothetical protein